jgi:hypothetical protein
MPNYESLLLNGVSMRRRKSRQPVITCILGMSKGPILLNSTITFTTENTGRCRQIYESEFDLEPDKAREHLDVTKKMIVHSKKLLKLSD